MTRRAHPPAVAGLVVLVLALAALLVFALPRHAEAQSMPNGSYQNTCKDFIFFKGGGLSAICRERDGRFGARTALPGARRCPWIVNNDGVLACASAQEVCEKRCREQASRRPGAYDSCFRNCPR